MKNITLGAIFAIGFKIAVAIVVLLFLGIHSLTFFQKTFTGQNEIYAYLGFGLTAGGLIAYAIAFKWHKGTKLQQAVSITMIAVCAFGELVTAGFGIQLEILQPTADDIRNMILAVQVLAFLHAVGLVLDFIGEEIVQAFQQPADAPIPVPADSPFALKEQNIPTPTIDKDKSTQTDDPFRGQPTD